MDGNVGEVYDLILRTRINAIEYAKRTGHKPKMGENTHTSDFILDIAHVYQSTGNYKLRKADGKKR